MEDELIESSMGCDDLLARHSKGAANKKRESTCGAIESLDSTL